MIINRIKELAELLKNDEAYKYSIENKDIENLALVLRAHGFPYDLETCCEIFDFEG